MTTIAQEIKDTLAKDEAAGEHRDPARRERILKLIERIWLKQGHADMRLGQLLVNFTDGTTFERNPYFFEDNLLEAQLAKALPEVKVGQIRQWSGLAAGSLPNGRFFRVTEENGDGHYVDGPNGAYAYSPPFRYYGDGKEWVRDHSDLIKDVA